MLKLAIVGASGYAGGELVRLALSHPEVQLVRVTSRTLEGRPLEAAHPNLRGTTSLCFEPHERAAAGGVDCVMIALPHGKSAAVVDSLPPELPVIDLGADFRLRDAAQFERHYGTVRSPSAGAAEFCYGLSELFAEQIARNRRVANPGCFATAVLLGVSPLAEAGALEGPVIVDAKTGSSGSGAAPAPNTHHPSRDGSFYAYKPFAHQHLPEIEQALGDLTGGRPPEVLLQVHSAPMSRGIFASIYCRLSNGADDERVAEIFRDRYKPSPLIRLVEGSPNVKWVAHSSFADIGWARCGRRLAVFVAIDNLLKGAAGQAFQNFNLIFGLPQQTGLTAPGGHP